jgi:cell division cycle 20-like protein 1, cofactor of APC complex
MSSTHKPREGSAGQSSQKKRTLDRFIPHTVARNLFNAPRDTIQGTHYESLLNQNLIHQQPKILHFHEQELPKENRNPNLPDINGSDSAFKKQRLPVNPYKVMPANFLKDDFYLNLLDYSDSGNIGVGLQGGLFVWSGCATKVTKAFEFKEEGEFICSLQFLSGSSKVAMGLNRG